MELSLDWKDQDTHFPSTFNLETIEPVFLLSGNIFLYTSVLHIFYMWKKYQKAVRFTYHEVKLFSPMFVKFIAILYIMKILKCSRFLLHIRPFFVIACSYDCHSEHVGCYETLFCLHIGYTSNALVFYCISDCCSLLHVIMMSIRCMFYYK